MAAFTPTKVAVEVDAPQQEALSRDYQAYLRGELELKSNEIHQLGFRLARELKHAQVHAVNAWERFFDPAPYSNHESNPTLQDVNPYEIVEAYAQRCGQEHVLTEWHDYFFGIYQKEDETKMQRSICETLRLANSSPNILRGHGHYLVDYFKVGVGQDYPGADLITSWYNRNLRIFANLQRITKPPDERLLLIIGGGHILILRHCVEASPEYELVEVGDYL